MFLLITSILGPENTIAITLRRNTCQAITTPKPGWLQDCTRVTGYANRLTAHPAQNTNPFDDISPLQPGDRSSGHEKPYLRVGTGSTRTTEANANGVIDQKVEEERGGSAQECTVNGIYDPGTDDLMGTGLDGRYDKNTSEVLHSMTLSRSHVRTESVHQHGTERANCHKRSAREAGIQPEPASKRARLLNRVRNRLSWISFPGTDVWTHGHGAETVPEPLGAAKRRKTIVRRSVTGISLLLDQLSVSRRTSVASSVQIRKLKLLFVGTTFAGKSTLINTLATGNYEPADRSVRTDIITVTLPVNGEVMSIEIWDVPGKMTAADAVTLKGTNFHAAIICFSVEAEDNMMAIYHWKNEIDRWLIDCPFFMLGTKADTRPSSAPLLPQLNFVPAVRPIMFHVANSNCRFLGGKYFECTATTHESVFGTIDQIITATIKYHDDWEAEKDKRDQPRQPSSWCFS
ncbi:P-loop containing nucleoside triphosphate hydrolase protein [Thozetella sp. PMI_491]|nr:P-loop containing nucleoside triphosphate hydrolase protein [Thozetella sp. PMI_491]